MIIKYKFPNHPADIIFKCHLFLQTWTPLGKRRDADRMTEAMERIRLIQIAARHQALCFCFVLGWLSVYCSSVSSYSGLGRLHVSYLGFGR